MVSVFSEYRHQGVLSGDSEMGSHHQKIRESSGIWRFIALKRPGNRYAWDDRPGCYFVEWWEGPKRRRLVAGQTPSEATEAQRRKRNELVGEAIFGGKGEAPKPAEAPLTLLTDATQMFLQQSACTRRTNRAHRPAVCGGAGPWEPDSGQEDFCGGDHAPGH
jgi:hypothetical protein